MYTVQGVSLLTARAGMCGDLRGVWGAIFGSLCRGNGGPGRRPCENCTTVPPFCGVDGLRVPKVWCQLPPNVLGGTPGALWRHLVGQHFWVTRLRARGAAKMRPTCQPQGHFFARKQKVATPTFCLQVRLAEESPNPCPDHKLEPPILLSADATARPVYDGTCLYGGDGRSCVAAG